MAFGPDPLPPGRVLHERYSIEQVLGQGGFGITYLAADQDRRDRCVIKELAPALARRLDDNRLSFDAIGESAARQLRHQFTREARVLRSLNVPTVPAIRDTFEELGTAYFACDWIAGARTLDSVLRQVGRMSEEEVRDFLQQVAAILGKVHERGILHRDLKPSNILVDGDGIVHLIDFGSARAWHQDLTVSHTVQYTPGFAPPEQLSERGRRGPATDIYGLCATAYAMLAGEPPTASTDRLAGVPVRPLSDFRTDLSGELVAAIGAGLAWRMAERPPTVDTLLDLLSGTSAGHHESLAVLDARKVRMAKLRFDKRECPGCHGVLESPRPAPARTCIVCRAGRIRDRHLVETRCPVCRTGTLKMWSLAKHGPRWCPVCRFGELRSSLGLPWKPRTWACAACSEQFQEFKGEVVRESTGDQGTWSEWLGAALRSETSMVCDACEAQFDAQTDGRWRLMRPRPKTMGFRDLYPDEWARVAANLQPDQGNAACDDCGADYFAEEGHFTLLDSSDDPFGAREQFAGVRLDEETARWIAVGKLSGCTGLLCAKCGTEFDAEPGEGEWTLYTTTQPALRSFIGQTGTPENWHRRGQWMPDVGNESELDDQIHEAVRRAYSTGELPWGAKRGGAVSCPAEWLTESDAVAGTLTLSDEELTFGGMIRKRRLDLAGLSTAKAEGEILHLEWEDGSRADLRLEPQTLVIPLSSGAVEMTVTPRDLARRLARR